MSEKVKKMFGSIAEHYDRANHILSFGTHHSWRKRSLRYAKIDKSFPLDILDICCGTGDFLLATHKKVHPNSKLIGIDFTWEMLPLASKKFQTSKYFKKPMELLHADALKLPFADKSFDLCTIGFGIRNLDSTEEGLREIKRVLKFGGKVVILEFGTPWLPIIKESFNLYSKYIIPRLGKMITGNQEAYEYLPETSAQYPCGKDFCKILEKENFSKINSYSFFGGIAYCYLASK